MNLFSVPLDKISFSDLEAFLGLALPDDQRVKEGETIDYKDSLPQELGHSVAGMANTSGGLIFIGIKSDKTKQNIPVAWPGIQPKPDLETQIVAKIVSSVRPKPDFRIGTVTLPNGSVISVIRVLEGSYPPYEYEQGMSTKISIRVHDALKSANVREIEALFKKRTEGAPLTEQTILQYINATGFDCKNANGNQDLELHRVVVVPRRQGRIRLDSSFERELEVSIIKHFPLESAISESNRRGEYVQFEAKRGGTFQWHHLWRVYENGTVGYTGSLRNDFPEGKPIGDLALDMISVCRLSQQLLLSAGIQGEVYLAQFIRAASANFVAKMPVLPGHDYAGSSAISIPQLREISHDRSTYYQVLQSNELAEPYAAISEILLYNLREIREIRIDFDRFLSEIQRLKPLPTKGA
jgi:hypothetical protein